ncbi:hypothetical protein [Candidatus Contubernalis alkaliaceticus]|uniref:hypothetical protein n=1 Tax=Candidatus Contubernalis alkaliaceticus TaxID=338645 RepID=UPI001F4BE587|nr:hypothetical protein [Candidatus Contubernalis alkalaceticus]UNC90988.1 hypothetical protein HUE98_02165 [Candidatus Contubernalis alkalaceticus]
MKFKPVIGRLYPINNTLDEPGLKSFVNLKLQLGEVQGTALAVTKYKYHKVIEKNPNFKETVENGDEDRVTAA